MKVEWAQTQAPLEGAVRDQLIPLLLGAKCPVEPYNQKVPKAMQIAATEGMIGVGEC